MKIIKYNFCNIVDGKEVFFNVAMGWNEANEEVAKKEAYNGEYTVEDDGKEEPLVEPTADDVLNALLGVK